MANEVKRGDDWAPWQNELVVADYFAMLDAELTGRNYVKAEHRRGLKTQIDRSDGSFEFKYRNISAVLQELGLPWIHGYKPALNYQKEGLPEVVEHFLDFKTGLAEYVPLVPTTAVTDEDVFVPTPQLETTTEPVPEGLARIVRKFNPAKRDENNRSLGRAGEEFALRVERDRLERGNRSDLAGKVHWVSDRDGDGAGYDILSFHPTGQEKLLEVKTTNGAARTPFFLSNNELKVSEQHPESWMIYRVHLFAQTPRIFTISPPLRESLALKPDSWKASFLLR